MFCSFPRTGVAVREINEFCGENCESKLLGLAGSTQAAELMKLISESFFGKRNFTGENYLGFRESPGFPLFLLFYNQLGN